MEDMKQQRKWRASGCPLRPVKKKYVLRTRKNFCGIGPRGSGLRPLPQSEVALPQ